MRLAAVLLGLLAAAPAAAAPSIAVAVGVGNQIQVPVAGAIGWFCDDPSLVAASLVTDRGVNYWVVEGVKAGTTYCRVGTDPSRVAYIFELTVIDAPIPPLDSAPLDARR